MKNLVVSKSSKPVDATLKAPAAPVFGGAKEQSVFKKGRDRPTRKRELEPFMK
jgi:hypothetical protein